MTTASALRHCAGGVPVKPFITAPKTLRGSMMFIPPHFITVFFKRVSERESRGGTLTLGLENERRRKRNVCVHVDSARIPHNRGAGLMNSTLSTSDGHENDLN